MRPGEAGAREPLTVIPIDELLLDTTIPHMNRYVRAMAELQLKTGMRPGELCRMRIGNIDFTSRKAEGLWLYRPENHKTAWRGHERVVRLGPAAQKILLPLRSGDPNTFLFSPRQAERERREASRRRPVRSTGTKTEPLHRKRAPGEAYTTNSYALAVAKACERAYPLPLRVAQKPKESKRQWQLRLTAAEQAEIRIWRDKHHFHPNQLRHLAATKVRAEYGAEAALIFLGDKSTRMIDVYAERDDVQLERMMQRYG